MRMAVRHVSTRLALALLTRGRCAGLLLAAAFVTGCAAPGAQVELEAMPVFAPRSTADSPLAVLPDQRYRLAYGDQIEVR